MCTNLFMAQSIATGQFVSTPEDACCNSRPYYFVRIHFWNVLIKACTVVPDWGLTVTPVHLPAIDTS